MEPTEDEEEEYVELDLEKTLTWTGNAVSIQAGGEFRLPLTVPQPSVLAIQFEVEGGYDIEFSLHFKDAQEDASNVLVEPVRVADREGQLDIDTTGVCELLWSNQHAWMSSKVLSYQLQLAPKVNTQMRKFRSALLSAADDYRVLAAAEAADEIDRSLRTLPQRTAKLQQEVGTSKEKASAASARHERYLGHVKRLEAEVAAAVAHAEQAATEMAAAHSEAAGLEKRLATMTNIRSIDDAIDANVLRSLRAADEPLDLLFEAYAGCMYPQEDAADESVGGGGEDDVKIDRAEFIHLLQDFEVMGRGPPGDAICGVFMGVGQALSPSEFKQCTARAAIALGPGEVVENGTKHELTADEKLHWLLAQLPLKIEATKLPALDVQRRVRVLAAAEQLSGMLSDEQ